MSLKRFAIEEWVGSLVFSSIPISGRDKLFKYLLVSNSVLLAAFSKIVLYEYCQTWLTFTCLIPPHSLDGKFSLSRPRLVAGPDRAGWLQDAVECTIPPQSLSQPNQSSHDWCCRWSYCHITASSSYISLHHHYCYYTGSILSSNAKL